MQTKKTYLNTLKRNDTQNLSGGWKWKSYFTSAYAQQSTISVFLERYSTKHIHYQTCVVLNANHTQIIVDCHVSPLVQSSKENWSFDNQYKLFVRDYLSQNKADYLSLSTKNQSKINVQNYRSVKYLLCREINYYYLSPVGRGCLAHTPHTVSVWDHWSIYDCRRGRNPSVLECGRVLGGSSS